MALQGLNSGTKRALGTTSRLYLVGYCVTLSEIHQERSRRDKPKFFKSVARTYSG